MSTTGGTGTTVVKPRVGEVNNGMAWTGGSLANPRTTPASILCYRPTDYKEMRKQHMDLQAPLSERFHLDVGTESNSTVTLTQWIGEMKRAMEQRGLDSVFRVAPDVTRGVDETYLLQEWGKANLAEVKDFVAKLKSNNDKYDLDNLDFTTEVIRGSLGPELFSRVTAFAAPDATGPELFKIAVDQVSTMSDHMIRHLCDKLRKLRLKDIPGENVQELSKTISEIVKKIIASGNTPSDLNDLVVCPFTFASSRMFEAKAMNLYTTIENKTYNHDWRSILDSLTGTYLKLVQQDLYPPANVGKPDPDARMQAMIAKEVSKLQLTSAGNSGGGNTGRPSQGQRKCFKCGSTEHIKKDCPQQQDWRSIPPDTSKGESTEKVVNGITYKWCGKCRRNKGRWNGGDKAHFTGNHRSGPPPNTSPSEETPSDDNGSNNGNAQGMLGYLNQPLQFGAGFMCFEQEKEDHPKGPCGNC